MLPKIIAFLKEERYKHVTVQLAIPDLHKYRLNIHRWKREYRDAPPPHQLEYVAPNS